jgi:hypothetical protein
MTNTNAAVIQSLRQNPQNQVHADGEFILSRPCDLIQVPDASLCMCGNTTVYKFLVSCFPLFEGYPRLAVWLAHLHVRAARSES